MANFLFVLATGLENPAAGVRCMQLAAVAQEEGHNVSVFLLDNGVYVAKKGASENIVAPTGDDLDTHLTKLVNAQVPFYVCTPCAKARHISEQDLLENAKFGTAKQAIALAAGATVFNF